MANDVFANGREISCKAADGKSICAFPDVCFTPPTTPATPPGVPIPYPNTGFARGTTSGSKTVKITGKEVMLKNKSYFKTSTGDEAGCAPKKGIVTSKIKGKVYFTSWSMDVKFEGENVVRHLDLTTHNHASQAGQTPPQAYTDSQAIPDETPEEKLRKYCGKLRADILKKNEKLKRELRKYDPVKDAQGGSPMGGGKLTKPGGHYEEIRNLQKGLKNDLEKFSKKCKSTGMKIDRRVDAGANQEIPVPPGISRIPLS